MGIEDKYDQVMELIALGKEKGYLLYDEVNELLPSGISNSEEIEDILATFATAGIEVIEESSKLSPDGKMESKLTTRARMRLWTSARALLRKPTTRCECICARWGPCRC